MASAMPVLPAWAADRGSPLIADFAEAARENNQY